MGTDICASIMPDPFRLQSLCATLASRVYREQAQIVAYLVEENLLHREAWSGATRLGRRGGAPW